MFMLTLAEVGAGLVDFGDRVVLELEPGLVGIAGLTGLEVETALRALDVGLDYGRVIDKASI
jgi:hypothetical protein